ncbi:MAG TPA: MMPL family transporter [Spirochaetota bacterium]|nr:MMPL family transporter [Spirochaetota bacterium]HRZ27148.1 MMPL family transporter [Spirochaetota bacterium]HSA16055.1 MMPL family transporter [Spirochaetota bacterium]
MKRTSSQKIREIEDFTEQFFSEEYLKRNNLALVMTGIANLMLVANTLIVDGQLWSIASSLLIVFCLIFLTFRNFLLSCIAMIPIILSIMVNFGFMGFTGITLNGGTAMVSSVAVGTGIDYAIHFITWYRNTLRENNSFSAAITNSILDKGRGIFFNVFSVAAGFLVLAFSRFVPLVQFGCLISLAMLITGLGAVIIIPSLLMLIHRKDMHKAA